MVKTTIDDIFMWPYPRKAFHCGRCNKSADAVQMDASESSGRVDVAVSCHGELKEFQLARAEKVEFPMEVFNG